MSKRLDYIDMAKGIGMVLVLLGHLQGDAIFAFSEYIYPLCVYIFSFHMPMFFIISGILIAVKKEDEKNYSDLAKKRFRSIMIPYYWFSFFYLLVVIKALIQGEIAVQTLYLNLWYVLGGYGMNVLWFLPALFLGELLFFYLKNKCKTDKLFIIITVISCAITFVLSYLLVNVKEQTEAYKHFREFATVILRPVLVSGFISIGYYTHKMCSKDNKLGKFLNQPKLNDRNKTALSYKAAYIVAGCILLVVCAVFTPVNNGIDFRTLAFRNIFFFMLCCLSGSFGLIVLCKGLPRIKLITFWGVGSLIFMATHNSGTVLVFAMKTAMYANQYLTRARGYICYAIVTGIILLYSTFMIFVIQKFFPFIIGKSYKKH